MKDTSHQKVVVAVSGGVDSAVACATLKESGYEVIAAFMRLSLDSGPGSVSVKGHLSDVQRITKQLDIDLHVLDYSWHLQQIVKEFAYEYSVGRTPNPCVRCNAKLKFGKLLSFARTLGASYLATGHYARIVECKGRARLARAAAREKDQSYVLFAIGRSDLSSVLFPNGNASSKQAIRAKAKALKLPVHNKEDSQEICFVPNDDYVAFLSQYQAELDRPGPIVETTGKVLGEHHGVFRYTIGQRRGLGIAAGEPLYVVSIDPLTNTVTVGRREALARYELTAGGLNWHIDPPSGEMRAEAQIRSTHQAAPATVTMLDADQAKVVFDKPQYAVTPGQAIVFYQNDVVAGGGWILRE